MLRLCLRLVKDGNIVLVILPFDGPLRHQLEKNDVNVIIHPDLPILTRKNFKGVLGFLPIFVRILISVIKLLKIITIFGPDIIHTNTSLILSPGIAAKITKAPQNFYQTVRGITSHQYIFVI